MSPTPNPDETLNADLRDRVDRFGVTFVGVMPRTGRPWSTADQPTVPFVYSIGLSRLGHPELIVAGLPYDTAQGLLATLAGRVIDDHQVLVSGPVTGVLGGDYRTILRWAPPTTPIDRARALYGDRILCLQLVWPDAANLLPGEPGCSGPIEAAQDIANWREGARR